MAINFSNIFFPSFMTDIGFLLFLAWFITSFLVFIITKDIVSPAMLFVGSLGVFFSDIFFTEYSVYIYITYINILLIIAVSTIVYVDKYNLLYFSNDKQNIVKSPVKNLIAEKTPSKLFWILSSPSIIAQLYMINKFGGFTGFLVAAQFGTREFHGLGPIKTIISTYYPVALFYYACFIKNKKTLIDKLLFLLHFILLVVMALLTLSRGTLLGHIVFMFLIWHYGRNRVSATVLVSFFVSALFLAALMGVIRDSFKVSDGKFSLGLENKEDIVKRTWMVTGTFPLDRVLNSNYVKKYYGLTYLTTITNFVPRKFWPDKPPPGGVVFTNEYASKMYDQYSHFTTGIYPEAIINFGLEFGMLFGSMQLLFLVLTLSFFHRKKFIKENYIMENNEDILLIISYVYTVWHFSTLLTGEFTAVIIGLIIKLFILYTVFVTLKYYDRFRVFSVT